MDGLGNEVTVRGKILRVMPGNAWSGQLRIFVQSIASTSPGVSWVKNTSLDGTFSSHQSFTCRWNVRICYSCNTPESSSPGTPHATAAGTKYSRSAFASGSGASCGIAQTKDNGHHRSETRQIRICHDSLLFVNTRHSASTGLVLPGQNPT